jgi:DNA repair photolyase
VLAAAQAAGARQAFYAVLRLPWELAPLFEEWLRLHYPDRAQRVLERVRDLHGISERAVPKARSTRASSASA